MAKPAALAILAHPDDETLIGPLIARYAHKGHDFHIVSITSGQKGVRPHYGLAAGDELGSIREEELRCSCRALGAREPFLLSFQDQGIGTPAAIDQVAGRLRAIINQTCPDVIITWGPEGLTGHIDHCLASDVATLVFERPSLLEYRPRKLYYITFPESRFRENPDPMNRRKPIFFVGDEFITTEVDCREFMARGDAAIDCHNTQWRPERKQELKNMYAAFFGGRVWLRLALSSVGYPVEHERCIFERLDQSC
jgi:LmbE family N-acetylglucosaminyl deacetylase